MLFSMRTVRTEHKQTEIPVGMICSRARRKLWLCLWATYTRVSVMDSDFESEHLLGEYAHTLLFVNDLSHCGVLQNAESIL